MKPPTPNPAPPNPSRKLPEQFHTATWVQNVIIVCLNDGLFKRCDILVSKYPESFVQIKKIVVRKKINIYYSEEVWTSLPQMNMKTCVDMKCSGN